MSNYASAATATAKSLQSYPTLCDPIDGGPPGSPVPGILQARTLEWVAIHLSRGSSQPRDWIQVSCIAGRIFTSEPPGKPHQVIQWLEFSLKYKIIEENEVHISNCIIPPMIIFFVYLKPDISVIGNSRTKVVNDYASYILTIFFSNFF